MPNGHPQPLCSGSTFSISIVFAVSQCFSAGVQLLPPERLSFLIEDRYVTVPKMSLRGLSLSTIPVQIAETTEYSTCNVL